MKHLHRYHVVPPVPDALKGLLRLAYNLRWAWEKPVRDLFMRIDSELYERCDQNPIRLLSEVVPARLEELAGQDSFRAELAAAEASLDTYLAADTWFSKTHGRPDSEQIAYFSMEFGIHESLPVYSGGLGVLAGDHLKSASDLGIPLVGVGIAFSLGYFRQSLDAEGWQTEHYPLNDWHDLPVEPVMSNGERVRVAVELPTAAKVGAPVSAVTLQAWRVRVGRVQLLLLDAQIPENKPEERALTNTLYGGDHDHRIRQELLLGIGGVRLLEALGLTPSVFHLNEGHSAFLAIERVRQLMETHGATFDVAREVATVGNVFTTHTPVPAGNDAFQPELIAPYLSTLGDGLELSDEEVMRLGRSDPDAATDSFSMPVLCIRMADRYNGVSELHGREARAMWRHLWPGVTEPETPMGSVTNGVHVATWVAEDLATMYDRYLGSTWIEGDASVMDKVDRIPDEELWRVHEARRAHTVERVREHVKKHAKRRKAGPPEGGYESLLDPNVLTIGFARRFATYKRGTLLLRDAQRLARILGDAERPVQLVFAGKAHPRDFGGKELIKELITATRKPEFAHRIVFVEDYEMGVARDLVTGVDVWLNTPRRPLEASGTSGMKACMNGGLHASILDGWWCEGYAGDNGFAIGDGEEYADPEVADRTETEMLYRLLEEKIVPTFYERDAAGLPRQWIAMMKRSIASTLSFFSTHRMVREYAERHYIPAAKQFESVCADGLAAAKKMSEWKAKVRETWPDVAVARVVDESTSKEESTVGGPTRIRVGESLQVRAEVRLAGLSPSDVAVELYYGKLRGAASLPDGSVTAMECTGEGASGVYTYEGSLSAARAGEHGYAIRVVPRRPELPNPFAAALATWG